MPTFELFETDTQGSWGIGYITKPHTWLLEDVMDYAVKIRAKVIVKTSKSTGYWYIKGINENKTPEQIRSHLISNMNNGYKKNSKSWFISYD